MLNCIETHRIPPQPWRNGGGQTRELLTWPNEGGLPWALRVSVAEVAREGPFSAFPGIQRWFAVLAGAGVRLQTANGPLELTPRSPALCFDGAEAPGCSLLDGPTTDLNVMVRSTAGRGHLERAQPAVAWKSPAPWRAVYAAETASLLMDAAPPLRLAAGSLLWCEDGAAQTWTLDSAQAWWLSFEPASGVLA